MPNVYRRIGMNENELDPRSANCNDSRSCPGSEFNDDDYRLELEIALRRKYSGRWAVEKWLLRRYFRRCLSFLICWFRADQAVKKDPDAPPF